MKDCECLGRLHLPSSGRPSGPSPEGTLKLRWRPGSSLAQVESMRARDEVGRIGRWLPIPYTNVSTSCTYIPEVSPFFCFWLRLNPILAQSSHYLD